MPEQYLYADLTGKIIGCAMDYDLRSNHANQAIRKIIVQIGYLHQ